MAVDTGWWSMIYLGVGCWRKMILAGLVGGLTLAMVIKGIKRSKPENDDNSSTHNSEQSDDASDDAEVAAPKRKSKRALKKEEGESSGDIAGNATKDHSCRFCDMKFDKSQALGGHMNRHRIERENEELQRAKNLVTQREQHYGGWNMQGVGAGTFQHGGNLLPNSPAVGAASRPYFPSNQPNWLLAQLQQSRGGYYNPVDSGRLHQGLPSQSQAHHISGSAQPSAQLHFNPGHYPVQQIAGLQSGIDVASHGSSTFQRSLAGPLPLDEIVQAGSTQVPSNNLMASCRPCSVILVDSCGNIPPISHPIRPQFDTHFQSGQGQGHRTLQDQHYTFYDPSVGSSAMSSLGGDNTNQTPNQAHAQASGSGLLIHMPSFQDSTDHDSFQGGSDQSAPGAAVPPDTSNQAKLEH